MGVVASASPVSIVSLVASMVACALLGACLMGLVGFAAGWAGSPRDAALAAGLAAVCSLATVGLSTSLIGSAARGRSKNFGMFVVAAGKLRLIASVAMALMIYLSVEPEGRTFWGSFLAAGLLGLVAETVWALGATRRVCAARTPGAVTTDSKASELTGAVS